MKAALRFLRIVPVLAMVGLLLPAQEAQAHHEGIHLEVTPEVQSIPVGSTGTLMAILVWDQAAGEMAITGANTTIHFENESGANDPDGTTRNSPDYGCVIPTGQSTCSIEIEGNRTGAALFRAWIDSDFIVSTDNSDPDEGRFANTRDCEQAQDAPSDCVIAAGHSPAPGTFCQTTTPPGTIPQVPGSEPDCTDVVEINFIENAAGTLDCDDSDGPDTEHEWNPSGNGDSPPDPSTEVYTCVVHDQFGNAKPKETVFGEIISGPNDEDGGANFTSADYTCDESDGKTRDDNPLTTENERGTCTISVAQSPSDPRKGVATICFWVGTLADATELCTEEPDSNTATDGSDSGDNAADVVELTWENVDDLTLDCKPEVGLSLVGSTGNVECTALSRASRDPVPGITVRAEVSGANDPDDSDSPETQDMQLEGQEPVELSCETGADGRCSIPHRGDDPGETTYRAWIDDGVHFDAETRNVDTDVDPTEGRDEKLHPGSIDEPDATDVVTTAWGFGPAKVAMSPVRADASIGECHEITVTATDKDGNPAGGVRIDVEQQHELSRNPTPRDEPIVAFCTPVAGPNPSDVDTSRGDLEPSGGGPNTSGTAGGETAGFTDENGQITIGVITEPANGSDGSGTVYVTTWWEEVDNDDPSGGDPMDSGFVLWAVTESESTANLDLTPDVSSADPGTETTYTATVTHNGAPVAGVQIAWATSGMGHFTWNEATTNASGQAIATVNSDDPGSMAITATCMGRYKCSDTSTHNWGPSMCDIVGTDGPDTLTGTEASETICGLKGDDIIDGGGGDDTIIGGGGDDRITGGPGADELYGGGGRDVIRGGTEDDAIFGEGGKDTIRGGAGNDVLHGDDAADRLFGNAGDDRLYGGGGRDKLSGNAGADALFGGAGNDHLGGGAGKDLMVGGGGKDNFKGNKADHCHQSSQRSKRISCS